MKYETTIRSLGKTMAMPHGGGGGSGGSGLKYVTAKENQCGRRADEPRSSTAQR